jgi:hypothetical protein
MYLEWIVKCVGMPALVVVAAAQQSNRICQQHHTMFLRHAMPPNSLGFELVRVA